MLMIIKMSLLLRLLHVQLLYNGHSGELCFILINHSGQDTTCHFKGQGVQKKTQVISSITIHLEAYECI